MDAPIKTVMADLLLQEMEEAEIHEDLPITVVNVLDREYYADCRIKGSINIPYKMLEDEVTDWDRDRNIVVYCASEDCPKSQEAFNVLERMGFSNIRAYEGGIKEWMDLEYPIEGPCQKAY